MKCPRCRVPVEPGDSQCNVCGEIIPAVKPSKATHSKSEHPEEGDIERNEAYAFQSAPNVSPIPQKLAIWWMLCCSIFAALCIGVAFAEFSTEAMWAAFISAALAGVPIVFIILGRTVQVVHVFRKELTVVTIVMGAIVCVYLLAKGIQKSNIKVETAGLQELATDANFTKTLITAIVCFTVIAALLPLARMLINSAGKNTEFKYHQSDSQTDLQAQSSKNSNTFELHKLELSHELELKKLELEKERIRMENERIMMLSDNKTKLLTDGNIAEDKRADAAIPPPPPPPVS